MSAEPVFFLAIGAASEKRCCSSAISIFRSRVGHSGTIRPELLLEALHDLKQQLYMEKNEKHVLCFANFRVLPFVLLISTLVRPSSSATVFVMCSSPCATCLSSLPITTAVRHLFGPLGSLLSCSSGSLHRETGLRLGGDASRARSCRGSKS